MDLSAVRVGILPSVRAVLTWEEQQPKSMLQQTNGENMRQAPITHNQLISLGAPCWNLQWIPLA